MGVRRHHHPRPARLSVRPRPAPAGGAAAAPLRDTAIDVLAVDLGKTGCRAALWHGGARRDAAGPGSPGLAFAGGAAAAEAAILAVISGLHLPSGVLVGIGAAGALSASDAAAALAERLLAALPTAEVAVTSDAVTAHAGALDGGSGLVLAVGTGAVALAAGPAGFVRVDGYGPWLGDEGSGAAIGLAGLRAALRAADGRGPATSLTQAVARCYGTAVADLPALIGNTPDSARTAARFSPFVADEAARGDPAAGAILDAAVHDLAETVRAAATRSGLPAPVSLALTGGVLRSGPAFTERLADAVASAAPVRIVPAAGTPLDGARLLATDRSMPHEPQIVRRSRDGRQTGTRATSG